MNQNRRKFLKIVLIGSASFVVAKILGPVVSTLAEHTPQAAGPLALEKRASSRKLQVVSDDGTLPSLEAIAAMPPAVESEPAQEISGKFKVFEDKNFFSVFDESGEEVFQIDKGV